MVDYEIKVRVLNGTATAEEIRRFREEISAEISHRIKNAEKMAKEFHINL